jgi:tetratricopeptide (TPR) repeat protein
VVLRFLARQAATRPMLMICACRDDELDSDERLVQWVQGLCREADAQVVPLGRLGAGESGLLIAALGDVGPHAPGLAARLHRETEGNPFFLVSMMQSLAAGEMREGVAPGGDAAPLPDALRAAVRARVAHVAMQFRPTLETAAVLGRHFDFDTLLAVTGASETALLDATDALVKRHLWIEEDADGDYDFSHDKIREVVYRDLGGARRRVLHQAVAEALERRGDGDAHEQDARLAEHFDRAQVWPKALHYMIAAGQRSQALFAMRDALHWLDRALALCEAQPSAVGDGPREHQALWVRELRGAARAQAGQAQGAVDDFRLILAAARAAGRADQIGEALLRLGMACRRADAYDEATACLSEALEQSRAAHDEHHAADTLYHLGTVAWSTGRNGQAIALHQEAVDIVERAGLCDLVAVQAYHGRGEASFANAEPAAAIDGYTRSLALARAIGDKSYESENLMMIGHACLGTKGLGDYARARSTFEAALDIARAADLQWHLGPTLLGLEHVRACTGHYGAAWTGMCDTLHWLERVGQPRYQLIAFDFMAHLLLDLGLNELALAQLERALALGRDTDIMFWRVALEAHMAIARLRLGHVDAASALQGTLAQTLHTCEPYLVPRCTEALAEMALAAGDAGRCLELGDQLLALAVPNGLRESEAQARRWRGEALLAQGAPAQALAELKHGLALADQVGRVSLQRDVHGALARASVAMDQPAVAQQHRADEQTLAKAIQASLADSGLMAAARRSEATC